MGMDVHRYAQCIDKIVLVFNRLRTTRQGGSSRIEIFRMSLWY